MSNAESNLCGCFFLGEKSVEFDLFPLACFSSPSTDAAAAASELNVFDWFFLEFGIKWPSCRKW